MRLMMWGLSLLSLPSLLRSQEPLSVRLRYTDPSTQRVEVTWTLPNPAVGPVTFIMPRAIPMGYGEQRYDRFVEDLKGFSATGERLPMQRREGPRWLVGQSGTQVRRIEYEIDVGRMERRITSAADASKMRPEYAGLFGYSVFGYIQGLEDQPLRLDIEAPGGWPVLSTLAPQAPAALGSQRVQSGNFYHLADSQILMGPALHVRRLNGPDSLFLAVYAEGDVDLEIVGTLAADAMERVIAYFAHVPFPHYTVVLELLRPLSAEHEYGFSMEHLDSGTFFLGIDQAVTARSSAAQRERTRFNFAHHMAHAWIPKRAYGEGYFPFTWELVPIIDTIWFSEGFARYAAIDALADAMKEKEGNRYRQRHLDRLRQILAGAPRFIRKMSQFQLSRIASTHYGADFRTGMNVFSRGALMAAEMDQLIRGRTAGTARLRDALRHLMGWSRRARRAFRVEELPAIFSEATGVDVQDVLEKWLQPPEE